jgi:hypothetical protein
MSKIIYELQKWCGGNSILIVTFRGLLLRLYCPFTVECISYIEPFKRGEKCLVTSVGINSNLDLVYIIHNKAYSFKYFKIIGKG